MDMGGGGVPDATGLGGAVGFVCFDWCALFAV
jgi:hypothetical protein